MGIILQHKIPPPQADNQASAVAPTVSAEKVVNKYGIIEGEYIVTFKNQFENRISAAVARQADQLRGQVLASNSIKEQSVLSRYRYAIKGFAAKLDSGQVTALKKDSRVAKVSPNVMLKLGINSASAKKDYKAVSMASSQTMPYGITRVGGPFDGIGKKAWVLDTGIDLDHPDLNVDTQRSTSFISGLSADDGNGHGTHVAGIIAAKDNSRDVVGVAAGATVVAVRVCYDQQPTPGADQCPTDKIMAGVDYVTNYATSGDVANISIWGPVNSQTEDALEDLESTIGNAALYNDTRFTLIAGNAADDAGDYSPGRMGNINNNVWTMSAYDENDNFATAFSNFNNPPVDFGGPGVDVLSLWENGGTNTISGTSMAAPHIAGILLATGSNPIPTDGTVNNDPDSDADIIAHLPSDLNVSISGPGFVGSGNQGTWSAQTTGGETPFSYEWYRNDYGSTAYWYSVSTSSSYSTTVNDSFQLRLHVTDDSNTTIISDVFDVSTSSW